MLPKQLNKRRAQIGNQGYTLIEVLITIAIFSIGFLAVAALQTTAVKANSSARRITEASALAENQIETLLELPYDDIIAGESAQGPYAIDWSVNDLDLDGDGVNDAKTISVTVNWSYGGNRNVTLQRIIPEL